MTEIVKDSIEIKLKIKDRIEQIRQGIVPEGYKKTRIGIIPEEWDVKALGDIAKVVSGGTPKTTIDEYWNGTVMWATPTDITSSKKYIFNTERAITQLGLEKSSAKILPRNSILMTSRATIGEMAINKVPMATNQGFKSLVPNKHTNYEYLYFLLAIYKRDLYNLANGSTFLEVATRDVQRLRVYYPPFKEQQQIANILSTWDRAIELKEALIKEKEEQKKSITDKLLTPKPYWKTKRLEEIVDRAKGKPVKTFVNGKYKILDTEYLNSKTEPKYTNEAPVFANKEDILLLWDGSNAGRIYTNFEGVVGSTFMRLRPKGVNNVFIRDLMRKDEPFIMSIREGSGIPHIPRDFLSYYKIHLPPKKEQDNIAEVLLKFEHQITLLEKELSLLKEQKKGLMQLLLTGIVRVGEVGKLE